MDPILAPLPAPILARTPDAPPVSPPPVGSGLNGTADPALMAAAREFEAVFLAEMLRHTGLGEVPEGFGGGIGEERFASLMVDEYARAISGSQSFGLAERIYDALAARAGA